MLRPNDLYTFHRPAQVNVTPPDSRSTSAPKGVVGMLYATYEVRRYYDLRNLGDLANAAAYQVACTQRIVIPNAAPYSPGGDNPDHFSDYPAIVTSQVAFSGQLTKDALPEIVKYHPRTLNSSVTMTHSDTAGQNTSVSRQHTSGSSTSQSNSFGVSASVGFFGMAGQGDVSVNYQKSWGSDQSNSDSSDRGSGSDRQSSVSEEMSVKDWACYSYLDPGFSLTWVWGQEHPWNVLQYRPKAGKLPDFVAALLTSGEKEPVLLLPPSQLAQFGLDFTMKSLWVIRPTDGRATVTQTVNYHTATQTLDNTNLTVSISDGSQFTTDLGTTADPLDLCLYGLDPVGADQEGSAIIGFTRRQFLMPPATGPGKGPVKFRALSAGNNLLIDDTTKYSSAPSAGFSASDTALTATLTDDCPLTMRVSFKITDTDEVYKLFLKHWKLPGRDVRLRIVVNGQQVANGQQGSEIVVYVTAAEAEGGEGNLSSITLRDLNYGSVDYHDYLQLGLNDIDITLSPVPRVQGEQGTQECTYQCRAISVETA